MAYLLVFEWDSSGYISKMNIADTLLNARTIVGKVQRQFPDAFIVADWDTANNIAKYKINDTRDGVVISQAKETEDFNASIITARLAEYGTPREQLANIIENGLEAEQKRVAAIKLKHKKRG